MTISLLGWAAMMLHGGSQAMSEYCFALAGNVWDLGVRSVRALMFDFSLTDAIVAWAMMLMAMMSLIVADPVMHVWRSVLKRRRVISVSCFILGFLSIWMLLLPVMIALVLAAATIEILFAWPTVLSVFVVGYVWQASPWKQVCLNRCHWKPSLRLFGNGALVDCGLYGVRYAFWCVGACWALMLVPMSQTAWHLPLMLVATVIMVLERARRARAPLWRIPLGERIFPRREPALRHR